MCMYKHPRGTTLSLIANSAAGPAFCLSLMNLVVHVRVGVVQALKLTERVCGAGESLTSAGRPGSMKEKIRMNTPFSNRGGAELGLRVRGKKIKACRWQYQVHKYSPPPFKGALGLQSTSS